MQSTQDTVVTIGRSVLQHGKHSDRVYLMSLDARDMPGLADQVMRIALENEYSKILAKVPSSQLQAFLGLNFDIEAQVPRFFRGREVGYFMVRYLDPIREIAADKDGCREILEIVEQKAQAPAELPALESGWAIRQLEAHDARSAAQLYRLVFESYPFPIFDEHYIQHTMQENVDYFGVFCDLELVALASAEYDTKYHNVEMTDFATLPEHRGMSLALHLLQHMEQDARRKTIPTAYTIARAMSVGMNLTFARNGYTFAGTLYSNTNISGAIESMNVWYKSLSG